MAAVPKVLLFDLDGTLYLESNGYVAWCRDRAATFLSERFGISKQEAEEKRKEALRVKNQTVLGLAHLGYPVDPEEFVTFMRDGVEEFLTPSQPLLDFLSSLPAKKYVFTNTREAEAERALKCLGIREHFDGVYGALQLFSCLFLKRPKHNLSNSLDGRLSLSNSLYLTHSGADFMGDVCKV